MHVGAGTLASAGNPKKLVAVLDDGPQPVATDTPQGVPCGEEEPMQIDSNGPQSTALSPAAKSEVEQFCLKITGNPPVTTPFDPSPVPSLYWKLYC